MTDLERFCAAMDSEWIVEKYELANDDQDLIVHYRSLSNPLLSWSHRPFDFASIAKVGTVGRIGFIVTPSSVERKEPAL